MLPALRSRAGRLLAAAIAVLLSLLALVSASAMRESQAAADRLDGLVDRTLPAARLVRQVQSQLDELRGLSALHLSSVGGVPRQALEASLRAGRQRIERQLAGYQPPAGDAAAGQHLAEVRAQLAAYWSEHDRLLAASRRAGEAPEAAEQARTLLGGSAQQAYQRVRQALDRWWEHQEQRLEQQRRQQRAEAAALRVGLGLALGAAVLVALGALGLLLRAGRWPLPPVPDGHGATGAAAALGARVAAARHAAAPAAATRADPPAPAGRDAPARVAASAHDDPA